MTDVVAKSRMLLASTSSAQSQLPQLWTESLQTTSGGYTATAPPQSLAEKLQSPMLAVSVHAARAIATSSSYISQSQLPPVHKQISAAYTPQPYSEPVMSTSPPLLTSHDLLGAIREDRTAGLSRRAALDAQLALSRSLIAQARALGDGVRPPPPLPQRAAEEAEPEPSQLTPAFSSLAVQQEMQLEPEAEPPVAPQPLEAVLPIGQTLLEDARAWPEPVLPSHLKRRNVSSTTSWSSPPADDRTSVTSSAPPSTLPPERTASRPSLALGRAGLDDWRTNFLKATLSTDIAPGTWSANVSVASAAHPDVVRRASLVSANDGSVGPPRTKSAADEYAAWEHAVGLRGGGGGTGGGGGESDAGSSRSGKKKKKKPPPPAPRTASGLAVSLRRLSDMQGMQHDRSVRARNISPNKQLSVHAADEMSVSDIGEPGWADDGAMMMASASQPVESVAPPAGGGAPARAGRPPRVPGDGGSTPQPQPEPEPVTESDGDLIERVSLMAGAPQVPREPRISQMHWFQADVAAADDHDAVVNRLLSAGLGAHYEIADADAPLPPGRGSGPRSPQRPSHSHSLTSVDPAANPGLTWMDGREGGPVRSLEQIELAAGLQSMRR